ncbi:hypothetical protein R3P38DRAFT_2500189 [Favolaschia claudopus]|uniref:Arrestin-like N-terminal domain-containing protein n=1 Tax=Favolaschia claudopus TaxID=2862362 RepID=A0AAW0DSD8_9AGAR
MSTATVPTYAEPIQPTFSRTPSYSAEPGLYEQRLALNARSLPRATGNFITSSKSGSAKLRLTAQQNNIDLPIYGSGGIVEGTVELTKTDNISSVEVTVEGRLELKEIAGGGHTETKLCVDTALLWVKDDSNSACPTSLPFSLTLPTTFEYNGKRYALPPSHSIKLSGLPGFYATIDYTVGAVINKPHAVPNLVPLVKSRVLGINIGSTTVSTPFIYYPRTRPSVALPTPLRRFEGGFIESPEWKVYPSVLKAKEKSGTQDIFVKVYVPASRIYCSTQAIPFHVTFESTAFTLAAFLPYGPSTGNPGKPQATRFQLMRQSTVDVRFVGANRKTDIWRVDCIGEGTFRHAVRLLSGDGATWTSFSGEIPIEPVKVTGFRIAGLSVSDCLLFTVTPADVTKATFTGIRAMIPVQLTTDPWIEDGRGIAHRQSFPVPPSPEEMGPEPDSENFAQAI